MPEDGGLIGQALIGLKPVNAWVHTYTKPQTSSTRSRGLGWRIHESVEDTKLSTNKQHSLYQPESGAEPVKKGGVLFRTGTNPVGGGPIKCLIGPSPLRGGLWSRTCAVWCWLMQGSYRQGEGTNGGRLRVFSSAQAPWRVLLQALDRPSNSGKWNLGQVLYGTNQKGVCWINRKFPVGGPCFNHF